MVKMDFFRPSPTSLLLSFLILTTGAAYMYISYDGVLFSLEKTVIDGLPGEKDNGDNFEAEKEQSRRLATFQVYCEKNASMVDLSQAHIQRHLLFYDNIKTVYCFIPKCGSKTMKLLLSNLEHFKTVVNADFVAFRDNYTDPNKHKGRGHRKIMDYSEEEARQRLASYKKIIVVRDPLERLASAWLDKFVNMPAHGTLVWVRRLNRHLSKYQELNLPEKLRKVKEEGTINDTKPLPFREFLFAISKQIIPVNEHWASFNRLCLPCQINYDFIAHTDTVASDVRLFLKMNNITGNEDIFPEQRPQHANADNVFSDIYTKIPREEILPLREIFQEDFDMFGYSFEQDLAKILEEKKKLFSFSSYNY